MNSKQSKIQLSTFFLGQRCFAFDVTRVEEIVKPMDLTPVPLAPDYVRGLINLRGQVATAVGLRELFALQDKGVPVDQAFNMVCRVDGNLMAFQVDQIGDVIEVTMEDHEAVPPTIPESTRKFLSAVIPLQTQLLSVIDLDKVDELLNQSSGKAA
jgi:purine-binding chemotaxis protein CheW